MASAIHEEATYESAGGLLTSTAHESHIAQSFWIALQPLHCRPRKQTRLPFLGHLRRALAAQLFESKPAPVIPAPTNEGQRSGATRTTPVRASAIMSVCAQLK